MTSRRRDRGALWAAALAAVLAPAGAALAQDAGPPSPEEIKQKVLEIERLMRGAEEALARSTDTRSAAERAAQAAKKLLDDKSRQETGKSADDLRQEAEKGSSEAKETLERLTKAADEEAREAARKMDEVLGGEGAGGSSGGASGGIRKLIERVRGEGEGASAGIRWLLEKTVRQGHGGGSPQDKKPSEEQKKDEPEKKDKPNEKKPHQPDKPPQKLEPPRTPEFEQWIAELPPQVRKAYETEDWDSIPPKWRELLREWTKKMADEKAREGR